MPAAEESGAASGQSELLDTLEFFQSLLFQIAKWELEELDPKLYSRVRSELLVTPGVATRLPRFVRESETPTAVWKFLRKPPGDSPRGLRERRIHWIEQLMRPVFAAAKAGELPLAEVSIHTFANVLERATPIDSRPAEAKQTRLQPVVVLGPDGPAGLPLLRRIQAELRAIGYDSHIVRELPEIEEVSVRNKVLISLAGAPFVVAEDSTPGGQIAELMTCKDNEICAVVLREKGKGSTGIIGPDLSLSYPFIRYFEYEPGSLPEVLRVATGWAEGIRTARRAEYARYAWRN